MPSPETTGTFEASAKLDQTLDLLHGGLSGMVPSAAIHSIENWESELQAAGRPGLTNIARDLAALRTELRSGSLDGSVIGRLLLRLGQETTVVASQAGGDAASKLHTLGEMLTRAGGVLAPNPTHRETPTGADNRGGDGEGSAGPTASGLGRTH